MRVKFRIIVTNIFFFHVGFIETDVRYRSWRGEYCDAVI